MKAGPYEIREKLGEGGMETVNLEIDPVGREVTGKTIRDPKDAIALEIFKRDIRETGEARVMPRFPEPNALADARKELCGDVEPAAIANSFPGEKAARGKVLNDGGRTFRLESDALAVRSGLIEDWPAAQPAGGRKE